MIDGRWRALVRFFRFQLDGLRFMMRAGRLPSGQTTLAALAPLCRWVVECLRSSPVALDDEPRRCCIILLSYKRPANIDLLARSFLRCDFVEKIIISNNNPDVRMSDWLTVTDSRIQVIDHSVRVRPGVRIALATEGPSDYYISVDDDLFVSPHHLARLFYELVDDPGVLHGLYGEVRSARGERVSYPFEVDVRGDRAVDHLTQIYAYTRAHAREAARLAEMLGMGDLRWLANGEDVLLSYAGTGKPRVHLAKRPPRCFSFAREGIATWLTHRRFFAERVELSDKLEALARR